MKKYKFEKSVLINADIEKVFNFHADTNNLPKISPRNVSSELIEISDVPLKKRSKVIVRVSKFGIGINWKLQIENFNFPNLISDLQIKGPFEYWHHYHIFEIEDKKVKMTDRIEFVPPFGTIGKLFLPVINYQLKNMFEHRHLKTKEIMEN